jgi:hypothetical protein
MSKINRWWMEMITKIQPWIMVKSDKQLTHKLLYNTEVLIQIWSLKFIETANTTFRNDQIITTLVIRIWKINQG